jgi:hypothetical protein
MGQRRHSGTRIDNALRLINWRLQHHVFSPPGLPKLRKRSSIRTPSTVNASPTAASESGARCSRRGVLQQLDPAAAVNGKLHVNAVWKHGSNSLSLAKQMPSESSRMEIPQGTAHTPSAITRQHMEQNEYNQLAKLSERELYDFVTEKDSSQRKWVALHMLEQRRNTVLTEAAKSSARAAWVAAVIAGIAAAVSILAYVQKAP